MYEHPSELQGDDTVPNQSKKRRAEDDVDKTSHEKDALIKELDQIKSERQRLLDDLLSERRKREEADNRVRDLEEEVQLWQDIAFGDEDWESSCHQVQAELARKTSEVDEARLQNLHISHELDECQKKMGELLIERDHLKGPLEEALSELDQYKEQLLTAEKGIAALEKEKMVLLEDQQRQSMYWASTNNYLATAGEENANRVRQLEAQIEEVRREAISLQRLHSRIQNREPNYGADAFADYLARCDNLMMEIARHGRVFGM